MRAEKLRVGARQWSSFLKDVRHDFYHLPEYVDLCASQEGGEACALFVEDHGKTLLLPILIRPIPGGGRDAASPYGYPGPLVRGTDDPNFLREALLAAVRLLADEGIVSLFVRFHPLLNPVAPSGIGQLVRGGDTISIDLQLPSAELWRQTRANHRIQINRALRAGRTAVLDEDWTDFEAFKRLYDATMTRLSATDKYRFGDAYFDGLRSVLGDHLKLWIVEIDGALATAGLFVETSGIIQYHLSGANPDYARDGLMKLVVHFVRSWGKEHGDSELFLGGGVASADDSLFHFKAGFSSRRFPFHTLRVVVDEDAYTRLVRAHDQQVSRLACPDRARLPKPKPGSFPLTALPSSPCSRPRNPPAS